MLSQGESAVLLGDPGTGKSTLLSYLAFIHKGLRRLPQARGELYEKCVEMLLKTWQEAKSEDGRPLTRHRAADLRLDWTRHKEYLSHLARRVQENTQSTEDEGGRGLMTRADAIRWLAEQHLRSARRHRPELDTLQAQSEMADLLDYLADYTGLLVDLGGDQFKFIHLSFLEHLAAWNFRCERHPNHKEFFLPRLGHQAWEEVLLLRLYLIRQGASGEEVFDELMGDIFGELRKTDDHPGWLTLVRAVRDNLDLRRDDAKEVLVRALLHFAKKPDFEGPWAEALKDVCLFSEENKPLLEEALLEQIQSTSASPAPGLGRAR